MVCYVILCYENYVISRWLCYVVMRQRFDDAVGCRCRQILEVKSSKIKNWQYTAKRIHIFTVKLNGSKVTPRIGLRGTTRRHPRSACSASYEPCLQLNLRNPSLCFSLIPLKSKPASVMKLAIILRANRKPNFTFPDTKIMQWRTSVLFQLCHSLLMLTFLESSHKRQIFLIS